MKIKKITPLLIILFVSTVLISCESQKYISVVVLNKQTREPINNVFIKVMAGKDGDFTKNKDEGYTNADGKYETYMMIGCAGGCYDIKIKYTKEDFETVETLNQIKDTVYLTPRNYWINTMK